MGVELTSGIVGYVGAHGVRGAPLGVHHAGHVVHGGAVWRARAHHTRGHVGVARHPAKEGQFGQTKSTFFFSLLYFVNTVLTTAVENYYQPALLHLLNENSVD